MLILSRKPGEEIIFNIPPSTEARRIRVVALDLRGHGDPNGGARVRIGIEAPKDITVHRKEIQDEIDKQ